MDWGDLMENINIGRMIKVISNYMDKYCNNDLSNINMTRSQMGTLIYLFKCYKKGIEVNQVDIEREFNLKNPTVTGILNRLEDKKYIRRVSSSKDKRYKKIELTASGVETVEKGREKAEKMEEDLVNNLTLEERKTLKKLLSKIIDKI